MKDLQTLVACRSWPDAERLLADLPSLAFLWNRDWGEVKRAWEVIEAGSAFRIAETYREHMANPDAALLGLRELGEFLAETVHGGEAARIFDALILHHEKTGNHAELASCLDWRARLHWQSSEFDPAVRLLKREEQVCREHSDAIGVAQALNNQALLFEDSGDLAKAREFYAESEQLHRDIEDQEGLAMNLCNQARLLADSAQTQDALDILTTAERLGEMTGNEESWARALLLKAEVLFDGGRATEARDCAIHGRVLAEKIHHVQLRNALTAFLAEVG